MTTTKESDWTVTLTRDEVVEVPTGFRVDVDAVVRRLLVEGEHYGSAPGPTSWDAILVRAYRRLERRHREAAKLVEDMTRWGREREADWKDRLAKLDAMWRERERTGVPAPAVTLTTTSLHADPVVTVDGEPK